MATFLYHSDVEKVMIAARKKQKGKPGGVHIDLPLKIAQKRKKLHEEFIKPARNAGVTKFRWIQDKLIINGLEIKDGDTWASVQQTVLNKQNSISLTFILGTVYQRKSNNILFPVVLHHQTRLPYFQ